MAPSDFPQEAKNALIEQKICTAEELNQAVIEPDCCSIEGFYKISIITRLIKRVSGSKSSPVLY